MSIYTNNDRAQTLDSINQVGLPQQSASPNWNAAKVVKLISEGEYQTAFNQLKGHSSGLEVTNIKAVLLMRLGRPSEAVSLLRPLVLDPNMLSVKPGVPDNVAINFATALLMTGHVGGCLDILASVADQSSEPVKRVRSCVRDWEKTLGWMSWFDWKICGIEHVSHDLTLSQVPGVFDWELEPVTSMPAGPANTRTATSVHDLAV